MRKQLLILALVCPTLFRAQSWETAANINIPVRAGNTVSYSSGGNHWLYIISGRDQNNLMLKSLQRYHVNTNNWDTLAPHPTGLLGGATAIIQDSIYVVGGVVNPPGIGQSTVYKYSITQNTWSQAADFPYAVADAKAVSYQDSLIYAAGGYAGGNTGTVMLYNARTNAWRSATPFPSGGKRSFGGFTRIGDTLMYMCGTLAFGSSSVFNTVYVGIIDQNDHALINWTTGANFPGQTRSFFDAAPWGSKGMIMTGGSTNNSFSTNSPECYVYSPGNNTWTQLPDKPTSWLTGQSASVELPGNVWKLICASGYKNAYLQQTEILTDTLFPTGINTTVAGNYSQASLRQNFPNPADSQTLISFTLKAAAKVSLVIYDNKMKKVSTLYNGYLQAGEHRFTANVTNLPVGAYYYTLQSEQFSLSRKMCIVH